MLLPHPESDLKLNMMVLGFDILEILKQKDYVLIENLLDEFLHIDKKRTPDMFFNTLTFLFSCGVIEKKEYKVRIVIRESKQMNIFE